MPVPNADVAGQAAPIPFAAIFEAATEAFLVADDQRHYVAANPAACALLGRTLAEVLAMRIAMRARKRGRGPGGCGATIVAPLTTVACTTSMGVSGLFDHAAPGWDG